MKNKTKEQLAEEYAKNCNFENNYLAHISGYDSRQPEIDRLNASLLDVTKKVFISKVDIYTFTKIIYCDKSSTSEKIEQLKTHLNKQNHE